jgi:ribonuclease P protein component
MRKTFRKYERLSSQKIIDQLFKKGSENVGTAFCYPFRVSYLTDPHRTESLPAVLFSIPKRSFRHATDRNLLRRRCKEAYRLNKQLLLLVDAHQVLPAYVVFAYVAKDIMEFDEIERKMQKTLTLLRQIPTAGTASFPRNSP